MDRVRTGIDGLDQLLCGGFLRGDAILAAGAPGTGKTSLGMQYLHNGITRYQEPGIFITFEEFPERIYRDAQSFGWDFRALEEEGKLKVLFTSPEVLQQDIVRDQGLVNEMIGEIGAMRVVVDSVSHLHDVGQDTRHYREAVYRLVNALKRESLTALLLRELGEQEEIGGGPEDFVADGLIRLTRTYVGGHHMRFLEVIKSRGSPHIAIPSLFALGEGGIRVLPPFQEPFYRFEEAVSTGISQLDDLLGGGIPYGAVYLVEIDADLPQDIFDAAFAREALATGDFYVRVAGQSDPKSRWRAVMKQIDMEKALEKGLDSGEVSLLWPGGKHDADQEHSPAALRDEIRGICSKTLKRHLRIQADISRLFALLPPEDGYAAFSSLTALCQGVEAVVVGVVSPRAVPPEQLAKLRTAADGIVRVWSEGSYSYLQVLKTVNSARSPVYAINHVPRPPFIEIMLH
jgi:circadian clock protein KaiC